MDLILFIIISYLLVISVTGFMILVIYYSFEEYKNKKEKKENKEKDNGC